MRRRGSMQALGVAAAVLLSACADSAPERRMPNLEEQPLVLLIVDTSGSMEYEAGCACVTPGCQECQPDCATGERNRYAALLETLGGRFEDFGCERLVRSAENGATYDSGYFLPYHAPMGTQDDDGLLDVYRDRIRFASATFDSWDTYKGAPPLVSAQAFDHERSAGRDGLWSYNLERDGAFEAPLAEDGFRLGEFRYPGAADAYHIDTGIRSAQADEGQLLFPRHVDRTTVQHTNALIQEVLRATRPYGGTPIAAALDDVYYFVTRDEAAAEERETPAPKHVVLIADGRPDFDYRDLNCDCATDGDAPGRCVPSGARWNPREGVPPEYAPEVMHCPYPLAEDSAYWLRCGKGDACDGPVSAVHVVGYSITDDFVRGDLDAIASAGAEHEARFADDADELRSELEALFEEILEQP